MTRSGDSPTSARTVGEGHRLALADERDHAAVRASARELLDTIGLGRVDDDATISRQGAEPPEPSIPRPHGEDAVHGPHAGFQRCLDRAMALEDQLGTSELTQDSARARVRAPPRPSPRRSRPAGGR